MTVRSTTSTETWTELRTPSPLFWVAGILGFITLAGVIAGIGRLILGLEATTSLNDIYPWGIWIGFDFGLIAFAGAGFTMVAVVHLLHLERFHAALRPAILVGLLGYVAVLALLVLDLGRWDRFYHFILFWNVHSPLFEISWCVLLYTTVLLIEVSPEVLRFLPWRWPLRVVAWIMPVVAIVGVTLSTLHQSTLGTLYLNMPYRLHPLWYTPFLPVLFYVSSIMAGLSLGLIAYRLAMRIVGQHEQPRVVLGLGTGVVWVALIYAALKAAELVWAGEWAQLLTGDQYAWLWLAEMAIGVVLPAALWFWPGLRQRSSVQWLVPLLVLSGVLMNRFDATIFAQLFQPGATPYSPHILEWISTAGILAGVALVWMLAVKLFAGSSKEAFH
ncbi:MAG: polysulfide reductase NrfD [Anaerolineales bacterium]|nr:polysulfide reductase NrfD [Anaerolineales bacterium]